MRQLKRQKLVDMGSVVSITLQMSSYHGLDSFPFNVRPRKAARVEHHVPNVFCERVPVPQSEMKHLMPAEKEALEMESRECVIYFRYRLRHSHVIRIFCLEQKLENAPVRCFRKTAPFPRQAAVRRNPKKLFFPVSNQPERVFIADKCRVWCPKHGSNQIVVKERRAEGKL